MGTILAGEFHPIREINDEIRRLNLASYVTLCYVLGYKKEDYDRKYSTKIWGGEGFFRQADREDKKIEHGNLKTMVAFMNSEGGTLLIGVEDHGNIQGIEQDQFENEDKFLLHFGNLMNGKIGRDVASHVIFGAEGCGLETHTAGGLTAQLDPGVSQT